MSSSTTAAATAAPVFYPGNERISFLFNAPPDGFFEVMGSFFNADWISIPVVSTSGTDNTPGAIRTLKFTPEGGGEGFTFDQVLISYKKTATELSMVWGGDPVTIPGEPSDANYEIWTEGFTLNSICSGTATELIGFVDYTTSTPVAAWHFAFLDHTLLALKLSKQLNAMMFDGPFPFNGSVTQSQPKRRA